MDLFTKQQKQQNKRVKAANSGVWTPLSSYAGSRHSPPPSKSVQRTNHSLTHLLRDFRSRRRNLVRPQKAPAHAPHRASLSLIRNDRKLRAEKDQITSNTSKPPQPEIFHVCPSPHHSCSLQDMQELNKRGPSFLRYCNEQTRLDHEGQLTNRTRGKGSKH